MTEQSFATPDQSLDLLDPDETPDLTSFPLATQDGRIAFLWALSEQGPDALLQATSHVWGSLNHPRPYRSALIAQAAGLSGQGKAAIFNVLALFLDRFEHECSPPPMPSREDYPTDLSWHDAVQAHFAAGEKVMMKVIGEFERALNTDHQ